MRDNILNETLILGNFFFKVFFNLLNDFWCIAFSILELKFLLLFKELEADDGELTRTRKVRRSVINSRYKDIIKESFPLSKFAPVAKAGHWVHVEKPKKFIEIVTKFIKSD